MRKFYYYVFLCILSASFLCSCALTNSLFPKTGVLSPSEQTSGAAESLTTVPKEVPYEERDFWDTSPHNGDIVIIGVSANRQKESDAIAIALDDAAKKVSAYYGFSGKVETFTNDNGTGGWGFRSDTKATFLYSEDYTKYIEDLKYDETKDIFRERDCLFIKVRYTPTAPLALDYRYIRKDGKPEWITKPPKTISGFKSVVGQALSHEYRRDAIRASLESAAALLLAASQGSNTRVMDEATQTEHFTSARIVTSQVAEGDLNSFYVLDVWEDPVDHSVWTLAIAKAVD
jgi:hypothetical protein